MLGGASCALGALVGVLCALTVLLEVPCTLTLDRADILDRADREARDGVGVRVRFKVRVGGPLLGDEEVLMERETVRVTPEG